MMLSCKRRIVDQRDAQPHGSNSVLALKVIWDSFANHVRPDIVTVLPTADRSCGAFLATATSMLTFVTRRLDGASVSTVQLATLAISVLRVTTVMH